MKYISIMLALILIFSCNRDDNSKIDDGLLFCLRLEKNIVNHGEIVRAYFKVHNLTNTTIKLTFPTNAHDIFEFWNTEECICCIPSAAATVVTELIFQKDEVKSYVAEWGQRDFEGQSVPSGNYRVIAYLDYYESDTKLEEQFMITN